MMPACVEIPPGRFLMGGSPDDKFANATEYPRVEVTIANSFFLSTDPVSVSYWSACPYTYTSESDPNLPVTRVSWDDAVSYCDWLSEISGDTWRLPEEQEWEYACRAGTTTPFSTGDMIEPDQANYLYSEYGETVGIGSLSAPGSYAPNPFGLHDMHGNVCEWTATSWSSTNDSSSPLDSERKTIRGGGWDYLPRMLRSSWRDGVPHYTRRDNLGFRVLREAS